MTGRVAGRRRWLWQRLALGLLSIALALAACDRPPANQEEEALAQLLTVGPEVASTLTAWPSPPAIVTRPPTPTAAPRPLWTAPPAPTASPLPTSAPQPTTAPQATPAAVTPAPLGSNRPPVRLLIPRLGLDVPVVEVSWQVVLEGDTWRSVWQTADGAAGHHRNSANPGEAGNVVISGHHNTRGEVFRQVSEIGQPGTAFEIGDPIILVTEDGQQFRYKVTTWDRFQEEGVSAEQRRFHAQYLAPTEEARLTLITCWPYESNSHRVIVVARLQP